MQSQYYVVVVQRSADTEVLNVQWTKYDPEMI